MTMRTQKAIAQWEQMRSGFRRGVRWWGREMALFFPKSWRVAASHPNSEIVLEIDGSGVTVRHRVDGTWHDITHFPHDKLDSAMLRSLLAPYRSRHWLLRSDLVLRYAAPMALIRTLELPLASSAKLRDMLRFELQRQSPVDSELVYFDYRVASRDFTSRRMTVLLRLVRREPVDHILALCRAAGTPVAAICAANDSAHAEGGNFPVDPAAARARRVHRRMSVWLAALALLLAAILGGLFILRSQAAADQIAQATEQAQGNAAVTFRLREKVDGLNQADSALVAERSRPMLADILAEMTRLLPDGSWLQELEVQSDQIRIQGYSHSAAALIAAIDESPLFTNAQLRAPLLQGAAGLERFDIAVKRRRRTP